MATTETQRTTLYNQLTGAIGQEAARTLMEQLPPSGWDQVATKDDVKASEVKLLREIADSELRQGARIDIINNRIDDTNNRIDIINNRIDDTNNRIDNTNNRIDQINQELSELRDVVRNGFAELTLTVARHMRTMAAVLLGFAVSMTIPLMIALL